MKGMVSKEIIKQVAAERAEKTKKLCEHLGIKAPSKAFGPRIIVKTYLRPKEYSSCLKLPDEMTESDRYFSTVGLIVSMGPLAGFDDYYSLTGEFQYDIGDWVAFRKHEGTYSRFCQEEFQILYDDMALYPVDDPANVDITAHFGR